MLPEVIDITIGNETVRYFRAPHAAAVPDAKVMEIDFRMDNEERIRWIAQSEIQKALTNHLIYCHSDNR